MSSRFPLEECLIIIYTDKSTSTESVDRDSLHVKHVGTIAAHVITAKILEHATLLVAPSRTEKDLSMRLNPLQTMRNAMLPCTYTIIRYFFSNTDN